MDSIKQLLLHAHNRDTASLSSIIHQHNTSTDKQRETQPHLRYPVTPLRVLIIDNYDSFTHNLSVCFHQLTGVPPLVCFNSLPFDVLLSLLPYIDCVVLSAGPGRPGVTEDVGVTEQLLSAVLSSGSSDCCYSFPPIFGVCLGLQSLVCCSGGSVTHSLHTMHGEVTDIYHTGNGVFADVPCPFPAVRYNSLVASTADFPSSLCVTAVDVYGEVMGVCDQHHNIYCVQFHPESICTLHGMTIMHNFIHMVESQQTAPVPPSPVPIPINTLSLSPVYLSCAYPESQCWFSATLQLQPHPCESLVVSHPQESSLFSYHLLHQSLFWMNSEQVFYSLFADQMTDGHSVLQRSCWWLDSSLQNERTRFSFMGDDQGPLSMTAAYHIHNRTIHIQSTHSRSTQVLPTNATFLGFLESQLTARVITSYSSLSTTQPGSNANPQTPVFPFHGGWVGCYGYEMKEECQPLVPSGLAVRSVGSDHPAAASPVDSGPSSVFIFADRFLVFDHQHRVMHIACMYRTADTTSTLLEEETAGYDYAVYWIHSIRKQLEAFQSSSPPAPSVSSSDSGTRTALSTPLAFEADELLLFEWRHSPSAYQQLIECCKQLCTDGESYELCLTNQLMTRQRCDSLQMYKQLRNINPAPYAAFFRFHPDAVYSSFSADNAGVHSSVPLCIVCSSPERFMSVSASGSCECRPIKGTAPRGVTKEEDADAKSTLLNSTKDLSENLMIVDLIRNDLGRVCEVGSVSVPALMSLESYATLHTLVTTITGHLPASVSPIQLFGSCFPPGSMTGAPKVRCCQLLHSMESGPRGFYSGCLGYISVDDHSVAGQPQRGCLDMNVVIRTAVCNNTGISIGVGGAILHQSDTQSELEETRLKAKVSSKRQDKEIQIELKDWLI